MTIVSITIAAFLFIAIIILMFRKRQEYQFRMEGARAMVKRTKKLKAKREEQLKSISALSATAEAKIESLWLSEIEFYQNIGETICLPSENSIKKVTSYVTKLLNPYYELLDEATKNTGDSSNGEDFATLEKRYQEKIDENEKLQKQIDILKTTPDVSDEELGIEQKEPGIEIDELEKLIDLIFTDISKVADLNTYEISFDDLKTLQANYQAIKIKLEEKLDKFDTAEDEFDQTQALIEQLRSEKVDYLKKYRRSMTLLFGTYKEYAGAFGLDAPQDPDIEIDAFEKFIEDS